MENTNQEAPEFIGDINIEYYKAYFGDDYDYYTNLVLTQKEKKSFNVYAFLLGGLWLLYRRLYKVFIALIVICVTESLIQDWISTYFGLSNEMNTLTNFLKSIIIAIILGKIGNYFLIKHAQKKISSILAKYNDEDIILQKIRKAGSGNWIIFVVLILITLALFLIPT